MELIEAADGRVRTADPAEIRAAAMADRAAIEALRGRLRKSLDAHALAKHQTKATPRVAPRSAISVETRKRLDTAGRVLRVTGSR